MVSIVSITGISGEAPNLHRLHLPRHQNVQRLERLGIACPKPSLADEHFVAKLTIIVVVAEHVEHGFGLPLAPPLKGGDGRLLGVLGIEDDLDLTGLDVELGHGFPFCFDGGTILFTGRCDDWSPFPTSPVT
jgi:hypothetical protein